MQTFDPTTTKSTKESCMNRGFLLRTVNVLDSVGGLDRGGFGWSTAKALELSPHQPVFLGSLVNTTVCARRVKNAKKASYIPTDAECHCLKNETNWLTPATQWLRTTTVTVAGTPVPLPHPNRLVAVTLQNEKKGRSTVHLRRRRALGGKIETETEVLNEKPRRSAYLRNGPAAPSARRRNGPEVQSGGIGGKR